jgi:hypothetical protein
MVAAPAATSVHGWRKAASPAAAQDHGRYHDDQAGQPAKHERQALKGALPAAQQQDERGQREGFECYPETDDHKVEYHRPAPR